MKFLNKSRKEKEIKYRYSIRDGNLFVEDTLTGKLIWEGRPDGKIPDRILPLYGSNDCLVLFGIYVGFENEIKRKNISRCNSRGRIIWTTPLPKTQANQHDYYLHFSWNEGELRASTWTTYSVTINTRNGRIESQYLTK